MDEILVDLLPRQAHGCACVASGHIRHASHVLRGLYGRGLGGCRLVLRPCVPNNKGGSERRHDSKRFHVEFSQKPKSEPVSNLLAEKGDAGRFIAWALHSPGTRVAMLRRGVKELHRRKMKKSLTRFSCPCNTIQI
jgi:hypothetical protein